jgi:hypothetical protein
VYSVNIANLKAYYFAYVGKILKTCAMFKWLIVYFLGGFCDIIIIESRKVFSDTKQQISNTSVRFLLAWCIVL